MNLTKYNKHGKERYLLLYQTYIDPLMNRSSKTLLTGLKTEADTSLSILWRSLSKKFCLSILRLHPTPHLFAR